MAGYVKNAGFMKQLFYATGVHRHYVNNAVYSICGATAAATSIPRFSAMIVMTTRKKIPGEENDPNNKFKASLTYPDVSLLRTI
jgi:hypothetical protein